MNLKTLTANAYHCTISRLGRISIPIGLQDRAGVFNKNYYSLFASTDSKSIYIQFHKSQESAKTTLKILKIQRVKHSTASINALSFLRSVGAKYPGSYEVEIVPHAQGGKLIRLILEKS